MRASKGVLPTVVSIGLILAVTAILWQLRLAANSSPHLIYIYLFPVTLIAALYNGRLAVLSTVIALLCADFFLEDRLYSFVDDNRLEYGDLLFSPFWLSRRSSSFGYWCGPALCWGLNHVRRNSSGSFGIFAAISRLIDILPRCAPLVCSGGFFDDQGSGGPPSDCGFLDQALQR